MDVTFGTYFFFREKLPINMKMPVFFLAKCVRTAAKTMVVDRKKQKALALLYLASRPLRYAANSSGVPTEENRQQGWSPKANWTFPLNFFVYIFPLKLNFSPSTKKTIESSFEVFLSINKIVFDFYCLCLFCFNAGHHAISRTVRTDGRTVTWLLRHYQNFLAW